MGPTVYPFCDLGQECSLFRASVSSPVKWVSAFVSWGSQQGYLGNVLDTVPGSRQIFHQHGSLLLLSPDISSWDSADFMVSPRDAQRDGVTPFLYFSFPSSTPPLHSLGPLDRRMRTGYLSQSACHLGGGSGGSARSWKTSARARVWLGRSALGLTSPLYSAKMLGRPLTSSVADLGLPWPSQLVRKGHQTLAFAHVHLHDSEPPNASSPRQG